ncbi:MAG: potassium channel family protein [Allosphingosinicella sp.]
MIIFLLGLFSMMAQLEYPPISIRAAAFIGIMSLVSLIVAFASIFRHFGIVDSLNATLDRDPIDCLYFSVVTWTTLGYGDFRPSAAIRMTAAAEALIGYVGMVGLISISAQYIVATVGLSEQEIDKFNKGLERYESKRSDNPRTRKKRG